MIECGSLEYALARVCARHGVRTSEAEWQRLETAREFEALLDLARHGPLQAWVVGLTPDSDAHHIDAVMRSHWRAVVAETSGWLPLDLHDAIHWCAVAPDLPVLQHLAQGREPKAWMHADPALRPLCDAPPARRASALALTPYAPLAPAWARPPSLGKAWFEEWQRRLPASATHDESLHGWLALLLRHGQVFASAPVPQGRALRQALRTRLCQALRRWLMQTAPAFVHLSLCALDLERLRGELVTRAVFRTHMPAGAP